MSTRFACGERWEAAGAGGEHVIHPARRILVDEIVNDVGGTLELQAAIVTQPLPRLPSRIMQIRPRTGLRGNLGQPIYLARSSEVVMSRRVRPAAELRQMLELPHDFPIGVVFFDRDEHLEIVWARRSEVVRGLAATDYAFVASPSYSLYESRPRLEQLYNLRRTDVFTGLLAAAGVPVIPRIDWMIRADINRVGAWLAANPVVSVVALDWMTMRSRRGWDLALNGLRLLDDQTGRRLRYLINGPSNGSRRDLLEEVFHERVTTTKSSLASPPPEGAVKTFYDPYCMRAREEEEFADTTNRLPAAAGLAGREESQSAASTDNDALGEAA